MVPNSSCSRPTSKAAVTDSCRWTLDCVFVYELYYWNAAPILGSTMTCHQIYLLQYLFMFCFLFVYYFILQPFTFCFFICYHGPVHVFHTPGDDSLHLLLYCLESLSHLVRFIQEFVTCEYVRLHSSTL